MLLTHLLLVFLFLNYMSSSSSLLSTLPTSVFPYWAELNWCVSWVDHPSSCCLPTATLFPSCVAVFLCPPHPPPHTHLCLSLSPPLYSLPSFTLSCLLFSLSLSLHPSHVGSHRLLFPLETGCQEDSTLVQQSDVALSACVHVHVLHATLSAHLHMSSVVAKRVRECLRPRQMK